MLQVSIPVATHDVTGLHAVLNYLLINPWLNIAIDGYSASSE
jgi:hypothetical protein